MGRTRLELEDLPPIPRYSDRYGNYASEDNMDTCDLGLPPIGGQDPNKISYVKNNKVIKQHTIYINGEIKDRSLPNDLMNTLRNATTDDLLTIYISSFGGYADVMCKFKAIIDTMFHNRCTTVLEPNGASAAAHIFIYGHTRIVYPYSYIMFHNYSSGIFGKGQEIMENATFKDKYFNKMFTADLQNYLSDEELKDLFKGMDFYFDTEEMCKRGIATHVNVNGQLVTASTYLKQLKAENLKKEIKKNKELLSVLDKKLLKELEDGVVEPKVTKRPVKDSKKKPVKKKPTRATKKSKVNKETKDESESN